MYFVGNLKSQNYSYVYPHCIIHLMFEIQKNFKVNILCKNVIFKLFKYHFIN